MIQPPQSPQSLSPTQSPFQAKCKEGMLYVDNSSVLVTNKKGPVWSVPIQSIVLINQRKHLFSVDVSIYTVQGEHRAKHLPKQQANHFLALFANHQPPHIPIDEEIERIKFEIENYRLNLREVNMAMANKRSRYQQGHAGGFIGQMQRGAKNADLSRYQPIKEKIEQEKLQLERQLQQLKLSKKQGIKTVVPFILVS